MSSNPITKYPISIAPMMDWTDRHFRYLVRLLSKNVFLYTEMVVTGAILRGNRKRFLDFLELEHPIAIQLGGDNPKDLAEAARIAEDWGYDEINLNIGCPSDRVQDGHFGACLMAKPDLVAEMVSEIRCRVSIPVTVKHRIGIDHMQSYEDLHRFVEIVRKSRPGRFIVHSRIAILNGLSPRQNRSVPPLRYEDVYRLKQDFPEECIEINGGIRSWDDAKNHLNRTDGVMVGRYAYENPMDLAQVDSDFFFSPKKEVIPAEIVAKFAEYVDWAGKSLETPAKRVLAHALHLFSGVRGGKQYRRFLSEKMYLPSASGQLLIEAAESIPKEYLETPLRSDSFIAV